MNKEEKYTKISITRRGRRRKMSKLITASLLLLSLIRTQSTCAATTTPGEQGASTTVTSSAGSSGIQYEPESNAYTGLTFTFDPRLDKRVEWLNFEHWLSIMQHSSAMLYEALNGRAHLPEVRVLVPYRWRSHEWPVLHKPGPPRIMNRRLRYADSDVLVGFEDPLYKETPYAIQHDECAKQGLHIHMPISFLEQNQALDSRLKARLLLREFASHRYGIFKETGIRSDYMYPVFPSLPGVSMRKSPQMQHPQNTPKSPLTGLNTNLALMSGALLEGDVTGNLSMMMSAGNSREQLVASLRGFDHNWNECSFDTDPSSGLPASHALTCAPYLTKVPSGNQVNSFNLMGMDPFSYANLSSSLSSNFLQQTGKPRPLEWRQLNPDQVKWHLCGENFSPAASSSSAAAVTADQLLQVPANRLPLTTQQTQVQVSFAHNPLASNKQNEMCNERSAMDVIRSSEDFKRTQFSPSNFNRLPEINFKFFQEMPPRLVLCVEYAAHLYQAKRLEHGILEAGIGKFLAYDLIADSEMALVLFGLQHSTRTPFKRLDSSVDARLTLYSPALDPYEEPARLFTEQELSSLPDLQLPAASSSNPERPVQLPVKGTCSFGRALAEASAALAGRTSYDDVGADLVMITSGLFVEDAEKLRDILRSYPAVRPKGAQQLTIIIYPSALLLDPNLVSGFDGSDAEKIVRHRVNKLLLIQRITGAKIHLIREQLDSNGNVRMSTVLQFHQVFENLARGHSWEQTDGMLTLSQQQSVDSRRQVEPAVAVNLADYGQHRFGFASNGTAKGVSSSSGRREEHKLIYKFELDESVQEELIVGFVEPKQHSSAAGLSGSASSRTGKRFALKRLELRSPGGHLVLQSEANPSEVPNQSDNSDNSATNSENSLHSPQDQDQASNSDASGNEIHALFPYRAQLSVAGFHLRAAQLSPLKSSRKLAGMWTLSATADEPTQAGALAMARTNEAGDTLTGHCWIQTYSSAVSNTDGQWSLDSNQQAGEPDQQAAAGSSSLRAVKVFVRVRAGAQSASPEVVSRLEVEDESGNVVQNNLMLDDGLGTPDITRADGIHTQFVQRLDKPGFYRVRVELTGSTVEGAGSRHALLREPAGVGQDQPCCGSVMGSSGTQRRESTKHLSRVVYCGTFYAEPGNGLAQQRPAKAANLTVLGVDHERRRISLRWFESVGQQVDSSTSEQALYHQQASGNQNSQLNDLNSADSSFPPPQQPPPSSDPDGIPEGRALLLSGAHGGVESATDASNLIAGRYEIKLFTDRDILRRAFDAKPEVGLRFSKWHVEGPLPNSSSPTGQHDLTLRIPSSREGIYYVAIRIHQAHGKLSSAISRPAHFWLKAGQSPGGAQNSDSADLNELLSSGANFLDLEDPNELQQRGGLSQLLPRAGPLDGASLLILVSLMALLISLLCVSLIACLAGSRRSLSSRLAGKKQKQQQRREGKQVTSSSSAAAIIGLTGSGSSSLNDSASNCGGSQQSELASSLSSTCAGSQQQQQQQHPELGQALGGKLSLVEELGYQLDLGDSAPPSNQHRSVHLMDGRRAPHQQSDPTWLQHTLVNGYAYATVAPNQLQQKQQQQQQLGDLNQDGLSGMQSWPADILLSHYDKVKQARERNEAPPVMRVENLEQPQVTCGLADGLGLPPAPLERQQKVHSAGEHLNASAADQLTNQQSYLLRQQQRQHPGYFNLQLQQQLSSVLRQRAPNDQVISNGPNERLVDGSPNGSCSPALEGVRELRVADEQQQQYAHLPANHSEQPPQYALYCTSNGANPTLHPMISEPSIYSQVTNLQQVAPATQQQQQNYYANQWQANNNNSNIYSQAPHYNQYLQQQQQQLNQHDDYHLVGAEQQAANSAISEV